MVRFLPNLLTLSNLFSGCLGIVFIFSDRPLAAVICVGICLLADFLDGLVARLLHMNQPIGIQLDSLSDVVSFGVVPGMMLYQMLHQVDAFDGPIGDILPYTAFIFPLFGAYRLARFNIEAGSGDSFSGLPIPAAAVYFTGLYLVANASSCTQCAHIFINPVVLLLSLVMFCYLMVSTLPHFWFKFKTLTWTGQQVQWIYIILVIILVLLLREASISLAIVLYVFLSLLHFSIRPAS
ncbi:MAG: CDP-diacylglycerol--serine O-phosphatidyltransferase [Saprospiraceae bacterium]|nr:CDP-diacylglycerol--serine O-phosphatidyltransferase [Saprospiraceae bacterium]